MIKLIYFGNINEYYIIDKIKSFKQKSYFKCFNCKTKFCLFCHLINNCEMNNKISDILKELNC